MTLIAVTYTEEVPSVANLREHWSRRANRARRHRALAFVALRNEQIKTNVCAIVLPIRVTLTRISPRELDSDNLASAFKATRDGVADWLHLDDGHKGITWQYQQAKGRMGEKSVRIEIERAEP